MTGRSRNDGASKHGGGSGDDGRGRNHGARSKHGGECSDDGRGRNDGQCENGAMDGLTLWTG